MTIGSELRDDIIKCVRDMKEKNLNDEFWAHFKVTVEYLIRHDIPDDHRDAIGLLECMFNRDRFGDFEAVMHHQIDQNLAALEWFRDASGDWGSASKASISEDQWKCVKLALDCLDEFQQRSFSDPVLYCAARHNDVEVIERLNSREFDDVEFEAILKGAIFL
jgi:hypothetical protein